MARSEATYNCAQKPSQNRYNNSGEPQRRAEEGLSIFANVMPIMGGLLFGVIYRVLQYLLSLFLSFVRLILHAKSMPIRLLIANFVPFMRLILHAKSMPIAFLIANSVPNRLIWCGFRRIANIVPTPPLKLGGRGGTTFLGGRAGNNFLFSCWSANTGLMVFTATRKVYNNFV